MARKLRRRRGNVAIIMAFSMTVIMLFTALAIDVSYLRTTEFELQNAADAAAHAALVDMRLGFSEADATTRALTIGGMNTAAGSAVTIDPNDVVFGQWDFATSAFVAGASPSNAVSVTARRTEGSLDGPINLLIGPYVGEPTGQAVADATGAYRSRDIVIVQDITGSFVEEINDARDADVAFIDYMHEHAIPNDQIGMVVFTGGSRNFTALQDSYSNYASVRTQWYGDGKLNTDTTKTSGITNCYQTYPSGALRPAPWNGLWMGLSCAAGGGGTSQGAGIQAGLNMLAATTRPDNLPVLVLVSDGKPQCSYSSAACDATRAAYGTTMADLAGTRNVNIYTVSFNQDNDATQRAYLRSLSRGYGVGHEKDTPDSSQLQELLRDIASSIPLALVQ